MLIKLFSSFGTTELGNFFDGASLTKSKPKVFEIQNSFGSVLLKGKGITYEPLLGYPVTGNVTKVVFKDSSGLVGRFSGLKWPAIDVFVAALALSADSSDVSGFQTLLNLQPIKIDARAVAGGLDISDDLFTLATPIEFLGSKGADVVDGSTVNDNLSGGKGNDIIDGGDGDDVINGNDGGDVLAGGDGLDTIKGGAGNDIINGGAGVDTIDGGTGNDEIETGAGGAIVVDGDLSTAVGRVNGGAGNDTINGGDDGDYILGDAGHDTIDGGKGQDLILGGKGNDTLFGGDDSDTVGGDAGKDTVDGGAGDDFVAGGAGKDILTGGADNDSFVYLKKSDSRKGNFADQITDFSIGEDVIDLDLVLSGSFSFVGGSLFSAAGAEVRVTDDGTDTAVLVDVNGDGSADMRIDVLGVTGLTATDFIL